MLPLSMAKQGEQVTIKKVGGNDEVKRHLSNLGFVNDAEVTVVSEVNGNLIVSVMESRIAVSKEMARKIMVE